MRGFHFYMELNVHIKQYKQLQTQSNRFFVTRVTQHNLLLFTYKKRNHILLKIDVRFLPQVNLLKFLPCFRCVKAFCIQVYRHRLKYTEGTDGICTAY